MLVAQDLFLIQIETPTNSKIGVKGIDGKDIIIDCDYNSFSHSCRIGTIFALPISISSKYINDTKLNVGDTVILHHFVSMPDHFVPIHPGNIYRCEFFHIYATLKDSMINPIEDVIFVEPILEAKENMFMGSIQVKSRRELLPQQGKVFALSKKAKEAGLMEGDHVFFTKNADYSMKIVGNELWRMRIRNITLVVRDGEPVCLADKVLIKERKSTEVKPVFGKKTLQLEGEIIEVGKNVNGVQKGSVVDYYNTIGGEVKHNNETYASVEPRHINYEINTSERVQNINWIDFNDVKALKDFRDNHILEGGM